jgi:protein-tyrosine phosphatase
VSRIDAHRVSKHLWVGSKPPRSLKGSRFGLSVLCALEDQIPRDVPTVYCPLVDIEDEMDAESRRDAILAAREVNKARRKGVDVLVTCYAGVNRSAFVAALAMIQAGGRPAEVITKIRLRRVPAGGRYEPLSNREFVRLLLGA